MPPPDLGHGPAWARVWLNVDVPPPAPDVVPVPPPPQPVIPPQERPPEISEPTLPGQNEPVREPTEPTPSTMSARLQ